MGNQSITEQEVDKLRLHAQSKAAVMLENAEKEIQQKVRDAANTAQTLVCLRVCV